MALVSRIDTMTGLFCKRTLKKRLYSVTETYNFKEPTNRSHPICILLQMVVQIHISLQMGFIDVYIATDGLFDIGQMTLTRCDRTCG